MVGYQGLSSRSSSHRQSGTKGISVQIGHPRAPVIWATEVSTDTTRSRLLTAAAVSAKSLRKGATSVPVSPTIFAASPCLPPSRLYTETPRTLVRGWKRNASIDRLRSFLWADLPAQTIPSRNFFRRPRRFAHSFFRSEGALR